MRMVSAFLSVFPGRTATPRTRQLFREERKAYRPELLMQPEDVAAMVVHSLKMPRTCEITEISMRPLFNLTRIIDDSDKSIRLPLLRNEARTHLCGPGDVPVVRELS